MRRCECGQWIVRCALGVCCHFRRWIHLRSQLHKCYPWSDSPAAKPADAKIVELTRL